MTPQINQIITDAENAYGQCVVYLQNIREKGGTVSDEAADQAAIQAISGSLKDNCLMAEMIGQSWQELSLELRDSDTLNIIKGVIEAMASHEAGGEEKPNTRMH